MSDGVPGGEGGYSSAATPVAESFPGGEYPTGYAVAKVPEIILTGEEGCPPTPPFNRPDPAILGETPEAEAHTSPASGDTHGEEGSSASAIGRRIVDLTPAPGAAAHESAFAWAGRIAQGDDRVRFFPEESVGAVANPDGSYTHVTAMPARLDEGQRFFRKPGGVAER